MGKATTFAIKKNSGYQRSLNSFSFLFFLWPFAALLVSFRHFRFAWAKNIFWLFCVFFGLTFSITTKGPDSARYAESLIAFNKENVTLSAVLNSMYDPVTEIIDIVQPLITYLVSSFTNNPQILFAVFGLIFGYFYSRNIWYLLDHLNGNISLPIVVYLVAFAFLNPIWNINGIRMYTALHVFIYGLLPYLMTGNKKKLFWSFSSILFHFSFLFPVTILVLYIILGNRINLYFIFFIISIFIPSLNLSFVRDFMNLLPDFLQPRVNSYTNPYYAASVIEAQRTVNWYITLSGQVLKWIIYSFALIIFIRDRKEISGFFLRCFCFGLWVYGWVNIVSSIPSAGRFFTLANMIMFFLIIIYFYSRPGISVYRLIRNIYIPLLVLFIIVTLRIGFDYMTVSTVIGNPFLTLFFSDNMPLITYIKDILQ